MFWVEHYLDTITPDRHQGLVSLYPVHDEMSLVLYISYGKVRPIRLYHIW